MRGFPGVLLACALGGVIAACAAREPEMTQRPVALPDLVGSEWLAEDIDGAPVVADSRSTLRFAAGDRVDGATGCNRFTARLAVEGQAIRIGPLASTRRACSPALMDQERQYLVALARGAGLRLDGAQLLLLDDNQQPLVRYTRVDPTAIPTRP